MTFKKVSREEWLTKVTKDLKGKPLSSLEWELEGKKYLPLFHEDDHSPAGITSSKYDNQWEIAVEINVEDLAVANKNALHVLTKGANALHFIMEKELSEGELVMLLKNIHCEWISTYFELKNGKLSKTFIESFIDYISGQGEKIHQVKCSFVKSIGFDSYEKIKKGRFFILKESTQTKSSEKLGYLIKEANNHLVQLSNSEIEKTKWNELFQFHLFTSDDYFLTIAKIRALKLLWSQVLQAYGVKAVVADIVVTIDPSSFVSDENINKIKSTSQAMAAVIGGANRLLIPPSDYLVNKDFDTFNNRIAINIQHIMQMESYMDNVVDPSAGSYFIECLTNDLAENAWSIIQKQ